MKTRNEKSQYSAPGSTYHHPPTRAIRAFLAEDSLIMMGLLARIVSKDKRVAIVGSATDGRKALCSASALKPDLVITDLRMPGLDGAEVTRLLKQRPNPPIVVIVTSDDTPEARTRSLAAGADAFVVKSANLAAHLLSTIQEFFPNKTEDHDGKPKLVCESLTAV
jgi:DNA-binding NarL/FixJ family response regulator